MKNDKQNTKALIPKHWQIKKFEDFLDYLQPTPYIVESTEYSDEFKTPVLTAGKSFVLGNTNERKGIFNSIPVIIFDDFTTANKFVNFPFKVKSSAMKILKPKTDSVDLKFVFYYMQTVHITIDTHKRYWISVFSKLPIPIPPLPEQQAIVAKIETLLSELENGKQQLQTAQQQLKVYRQSLLKAAFEGKLTANWRQQQTDKDYSFAAEPQAKFSTKDELPERWKVVKFIDFCKLQRGYDLPLKKIINGKYPVVTSSGIKGYHNEFRSNGPCLITGRSGGVGNIHFIKVEKYWPHNTALFVKDFCNNVPEFVYYFFMQFNFKSFGASTTIPTLDRKQLYNELVQLPPSEEQHLIVSELESKLTICDKIEETISKSLQQAETLRQSILKKAFEGRLV